MKTKSISLIYLFFIVLISWSCSENKSGTILLKANPNAKLNVNNTSIIVQLESTSESMLSYILKSNVDLPGDRIFILSNFNIYIFTSSGKYLSKLKLGRGPGEITQIISFSLNTTKKLIYAIDNAIKLCVFDYDGNMINNYDIKDFSSCDLSILNDNDVILLRNYVGGEEKYFVGVYNLQTRSIVKRFIASEKSPYPKNTIIVANNFMKYKENVYFYTPNVFGIFKYKNSDFQQILSIDMGEKSVPSSLSNKYENQNHCELRKEAKSRHYVPFILLAVPFKDHFFIVADDDDMNCYAINMNSREIYNNGTLASYFNLPDKSSLKLPCGIQDNLIIFQCTPTDFFGSKSNENIMEVQIANHKVSIRQDDNPFLIIVQ